MGLRWSANRTAKDNVSVPNVQIPRQVMGMRWSANRTAKDNVSVPNGVFRTNVAGGCDFQEKRWVSVCF